MIKKTLSTALLLIFILFGCTSRYSDELTTNNKQIVLQDQIETPTQTESQTLIGYIEAEKDLKLNNLYLHMPFSELIKIMGKYSNKSEQRDLGEDGFEFDLFFDDGTKVTMFNDEVSEIETTSNRYQTPRGLKIGDLKDKVVELYHYPAYQDDDNGEWNYTTDNDYTLFSVYFNGNKVSKIIINLVM